jgi:ATP-dependent DNA helicase DinG
MTDVDRDRDTLRGRVAQAFEPDGPLARSLPAFQARPGQQAMAEAVAEALVEGEVLVSEAATGVGKTFAYLVPVVLSGAKVVLSTGTKTLQDQIFYRDLPAVLRALGARPQVALLKGRGNYLCPYRLAQTRESMAALDGAQQRLLSRVQDWARATPDGDLTRSGLLPDDALLWPRITSTVENCLRNECPNLSGCFVAKARRSAIEADIVVVNHHLLCADMALKEEGFGEVLPAAQAVVMDEAHQMPEVATRFFGANLSSRQLNELWRDGWKADADEIGDDPAFRRRLDQLEESLQMLIDRFGELPVRETAAGLAEWPSVEAALDQLETTLEGFAEGAEAQAERGSAVQAVARRARDQARRLAMFRRPPGDWVAWYERRGRGFGLNTAPLEVGSAFADHRARFPGSWVFTSATLNAGDACAFFRERLGLGDAVTRVYETVFDYSTQALLYHPSGLPNPSAPDYTRQFVEAVRPLLHAIGGRAFLLFTSHRALGEAAERLRGTPGFEVLVQGTRARGELIERFEQADQAVLLGTGTFWEGVDIRGSALSVVAIDRLPFAAPGDPVLAARLERLRAAGRDPFRAFQIPQAVLTLKQGFGRLIRSETDVGVFVLGDPRLTSKGYGRYFRDALPALPMTRQVDDAIEFLTRWETAS